MSCKTKIHIPVIIIKVSQVLNFHILKTCLPGQPELNNVDCVRRSLACQEFKTAEKISEMEERSVSLLMFCNQFD